MKKAIVILSILALSLGAFLYLYHDNSMTQKYYRSAEPMVEAYQENQSVFHTAVTTLSDFSHIGRIGIEKEPMDYIRNGYAYEYKTDGYSILTDVLLEETEYDAIFTAVSAVMDATDVSSFFMRVDDICGITVDFVFYFDYGVYAQFYYFENAQEAFPYTPAYPKDIHKIDSHWFACLSTDAFMAG